jgi:O-antigen/teichoic acid export membrane protein
MRSSPRSSHVGEKQTGSSRRDGPSEIGERTMRPAAAPRGGRGILTNLSILSSAQIAAQLLNVAALVYVARSVGSHWFGVIQFGVTLSAYALVSSEWGLWVLGIRQVARLNTAAAVRAYANTHVGLLMALSAVALLIGLPLLPLLPSWRDDPWILILYLGTVLPQVFMYDWIGIGLERMGWVGLVKTCRSLFYALLVLLLLHRLDGWLGWPAPRWVPVFFLLGFIGSNVVMAQGVRRWLGGRVRPSRGQPGQWRRRLAQAGPIGAGNLTVRLVLQADILVLGLLADPAVVGTYSAAAKVLFVLIVAVEVLWKALLPRLSRLWQESPAVFRARFNLYLGLVLAGFLPAAVGGALLGPRLMSALYGEAFGAAGPVFRVLSFAYVALALGLFFGNSLIASDRQRAYFPPLLLSAILALGGGLLLVPHHGALGACWAMLTAHGALLVTTGWICRGSLARGLWRPVVAALLGVAAMAVVLHLLAAWPVFLLVGVGVMTYGLVAGPWLFLWSRRWRVASP